MRHRARLLVGVIAVATIAAACGDNDDESSSTSAAPPASAAATAPPADTAAPGTAAPETAASPDTVAPGTAAWDELVAAAQEEGEVIILSGGTDLPYYDLFAETFDIEVVLSQGSSDEMTSRVLLEREQGIYDADVSMLGPSSTRRILEADGFAPLEPALLPDALDRSENWMLDFFPWDALDTDKQYVTFTTAQIATNFLTQLWYNTDTVSEEDLASLQSWDDVLDERWKGRIVIGDLADGNAAADQALAWLFLGQDWLETLLRDMDVQVVGRGPEIREFCDRLARGDADLAFFAGDAGDCLAESRDLGLPVEEIPHQFEEGTVGTLRNAVAIMDRAPHPNAAALWANWALSQEGQAAFNELNAEAEPSRLALRTDVPQGNVSDALWARAQDPGLQFLEENEVEYAAAIEEVGPWAIAIFQELGLNP